MKPRISAIAAMDEKRGIGRGNNLLFKIPQDFERMKKLTMGHPLVMGRKTHESIGRVLPGRTNIIITRDTEYQAEGTVICHSLEDAIEKAKLSPGGDEVFIFGGQQIFTEALPQTGRLYLTLVKGDYGADTFFPEYEQEFKKVLEDEAYESDGYKYRFITLER